MATTNQVLLEAIQSLPKAIAKALVNLSATQQPPTAVVESINEISELSASELEDLTPEQIKTRLMREKYERTKPATKVSKPKTAKKKASKPKKKKALKPTYCARLIANQTKTMLKNYTAQEPFYYPKGVVSTRYTNNKDKSIICKIESPKLTKPLWGQGKLAVHFFCSGLDRGAPIDTDKNVLNKEANDLVKSRV